MQEIRIALRGKAIVLMGKNTMMRKAIRGHLEKNPDLERLLPFIKMNVGFVFTKEDLIEVRDMLLANKVRAPAKAGALAPLDVVVPAQNTGDVHLITAGDKVGMSEATLLNMLKISPFTYGLVVKKVYEAGSVFEPAILDITDDDLKSHVMAGLRNIAALSLAIGYPTAASVPHSIINGLKKCK